MTGFDREEAEAALAGREAVARVLILSHAGSTPRTSGTSMLVGPGFQRGTIGGGALEFEAAAQALRLAEADGPARRHLRLALGPSLGQCCGGSVTLLLERLDRRTLDAVPQSGLYARPLEDAAPMPDAVRQMLEQEGTAELAPPLVVDGWVVERVSPPGRPLWLYGAGHVGRALVETLQGLDFATTWVDTAVDRFPDKIPAHATRLVAAEPQAVVRHAPAQAHHLVMTYSHEMDLEICHAVLSREFAALGLIGSETKRARFRSRLEALGHGPERLDRLVCPIGDPALGKTPRAIAVGVVSALLKGKVAASAAANRG